MKIRVQVFFLLSKILNRLLRGKRVEPCNRRALHLGMLHDKLMAEFPKHGARCKKVHPHCRGVDYQAHAITCWQDGDEVSLFPPVQGGVTRTRNSKRETRNDETTTDHHDPSRSTKRALLRQRTMSHGMGAVVNFLGRGARRGGRQNHFAAIEYEALQKMVEHQFNLTLR